MEEYAGELCEAPKDAEKSAAQQALKADVQRGKFFLVFSLGISKWGGRGVRIDCSLEFLLLQVNIIFSDM